MKRFIVWLGLLIVLPAIMFSQYTQSTVPEEMGLSSLSWEQHNAGSEWKLMLAESVEDDDEMIIWQPWHVPTIVTQIVTESVGAAAIGGATLLVIGGTGLKGLDPGGGGGSGDATGLIILMLYGGTSLGLTLGTHLGGSFWGASSDFGKTFIGSLVGIAGGVAAGLLLSEFTSAEWAILSFGTAVSLASPIIFYHNNAQAVSATEPWREPYIPSWEREKHSRVLPTGGDEGLRINILRVPLDW